MSSCHNPRELKTPKDMLVFVTQYANNDIGQDQNTVIGDRDNFQAPKVCFQE